MKNYQLIEENSTNKMSIEVNKSAMITLLFSQESKIKLPYNPVIPLLVIYTQKNGKQGF